MLCRAFFLYHILNPRISIMSDGDFFSIRFQISYYAEYLTADTPIHFRIRRKESEIAAHLWN